MFKVTIAKIKWTAKNGVLDVINIFYFEFRDNNLGNSQDVPGKSVLVTEGSLEEEGEAVSCLIVVTCYTTPCHSPTLYHLHLSLWHQLLIILPLTVLHLWT